MSKIIGIDCSTKSMAFSIFEDGKLIKHGEINFGKGDLFHRINNANRVINSMLDMDMFTDIDTVYYESATYIQNKRTVILLAYAFGGAIAPFVKPGVGVQEVSPIVWQNALGNKAFTKVEKEQLKKDYPEKTDSWRKEKMREMRKQRNIDYVKEHFNVVADNDNVADAICVGHYAVLQEAANA